MANILFPPIVDSAMRPQTPVGLSYDTAQLEINYTNPSTISFDDYDLVRVRIVSQLNNNSLVDISTWKDQFIYCEKPQNGKLLVNYKWFTPSSDKDDKNNIKSGASLIGQIIKIQLSYVSFPANTTIEIPSGENYYSTLANVDFSEWSSVMILKFVELENGPDISTTESISLTPQFRGNYKFTEKSEEVKDRYKFTLFHNGIQLESSDWIQSTGDNLVDTWRFQTALSDYETYQIRYESYSKNGRHILKEKNHLAFDNTSDKLPGKMSTRINYEDACVDIYYEWLEDSLETGAYVVARSSERDNFAKWEDLYYFYLVGFKDKALVFTDFTVESGVTYKYCIQKEYSGTGLRTARLLDKEVSNVCVYLPYAYLYEEGIQLKLKYNNKLSSYKHTTLTNKQDTLGSKYPTILRNGNAYYAEFPINGLISLHLDDGERFFKETPSGYVYKNQVVIPKSKYSDDPFDVNLTNSNFYIERIFREKVEEFLNNGKYKIFRSPVIGNHVVSLMNIQLTPNQTLGGMIAEFSGTAYEVMDWDYTQMLDFNIIKNNREGKHILTDPVRILGKVEIPTSMGNSLRDMIEIALENKYNNTEFKITSIDIDPGFNNKTTLLDKLTITDSNQEFTKKDFIIENGSNLNIIIKEELDYPLYVGYTVQTYYKESVYNGDNLMGESENKVISSQISTPCDEINDLFKYLKDLIEEMGKTDPDKDGKTDWQFLRLISVSFEGHGTVVIDDITHIIPHTGLKFTHASDINTIKKLNMADGQCTYVALIQKRKPVS